VMKAKVVRNIKTSFVLVSKNMISSRKEGRKKQRVCSVLFQCGTAHRRITPWRLLG